MKIVTLIFLLLTDSIFAWDLKNSLDVELTTIVHSESEYMISDGNSSRPNDNNSFSSMFAHLFINYDMSEDMFLSLGAKANRVLFEDNYDASIYHSSKLKSEDINKEIVSEASLNYDNGLLALNVGRQELNYDWLLGSVDGILAMLGSDDDYSLRLFWFENYYQLQYNYYMKIEDINANQGMYGTVAKSSVKNFELTYFDYYLKDLRNIMGSNISYIYGNFGVNLSYTSAVALELALYDYDEEFFNTSVEFLIKRHYFEFGYSKTGKNGLIALLQLGNFMFGQFYLSNQVDRENAQNGFLKYIYADNKFRFEAITGVTTYDNTFYRVEDDMFSYEVDAFMKYNYSKFLSFDTGVMYMNVDKRDPLQVSQALVMFNMVLNYENY